MLLPSDSGLLLRLDGYRPSELARESPAFDAAFETSCAQAVLALLSREGVRAPVFHWRSGEKDEVDLVVELTPERIVPIECKFSAHPAAADMGGIQRFLARHETKGPGMLISAHEDCFWLTPEVLHVPLSAL